MKRLASLLAFALCSAAVAAPIFRNDVARKTVTFNVIADTNGANNGMNFNGAHGGNKTFTVPLGWTVKVVFSNASPVPHSVVVVPEGKTELKYDEASSAFPGAFSPKPLSGVVKGHRPQTFTFKASKAGDFRLVCGVLMHGVAGQWVKLVVSKNAKIASYGSAR